ncbi:YlcG family protein, partial [Escherichia coli]
MMFESYMAERLRHRWIRLRLYRFPGSVLTDSHGHTITVNAAGN